MPIHPLAGQKAPVDILVNIPRLVSAYYTRKPDPQSPDQLVSFGTSGHRGSAFKGSFNEDHILAVSQSIVEYRKARKITGPLYMGMDTHALSEPALCTALEVFAANDLEVVIQQDRGYTPTPVISHAILAYNKGRKDGFADGVVITPSHNPPEDGGFKYNPPEGGPADTSVTKVIENRANEILKNGLKDVKRIPFERAMRADTTHEQDFIHPYVDDLTNILDMDIIADSRIKIGADPMGGSGIGYWEPIAEKYNLNLHVVNPRVDPSFSFMTVDKDGKIRMDSSSPYAMAGLINLKTDYDIAFGNDPDFDRHGIVSRSTGLLTPNSYLCVCVHYLLKTRTQWSANAAIGKTLVSSSLIDYITKDFGRKLCEVPVGFKWMVEGLLNGSFCFGGEESAGASFLRKDGTVWTTDKDGIILNLLAAEITARTERDPGVLYKDLEKKYGSPIYERLQAPATPKQKDVLKNLTADLVQAKTLAGEKITAKLTEAPGNGAPIGGLKVCTENGWFAARPSGTEDIYKIYTESLRGFGHLHKIQKEAQAIVNDAFDKAGVLEE
ncbi:MAG: phosphoglucomutase (alpha-D-glucose-1,6-bisphosphate-dependent) [Desulfovibrio sp.]